MIDDQAAEGPSGAATVPDRQASTMPQPPTRQPPTTGDGEVDGAVARLADLPAVALEEHPAVYEAVHRTLTGRLSDVEG